MIRRLYTLLLAAAAPVFWWGMRRRARREGGSWDILAASRFGRARGPAPAPGVVWIHAVSLGETRAAKPLVDGVLAAGARVLLTHATATARAECERLFGKALADGRLTLAWIPYDFPGAVRRFLAHHRPGVGVLVEREIWPNLLAAARAANVPMMLVSARLSARSAAGMQRLRPLIRPAVASLGAVLAQTAEDADRLIRLGAGNVRVTGNLKFDVGLPRELVARGRAWRSGWRRPVLMLASTRDSEEAMFIAALAAMGGLPDAVLILVVPRHPQRFDEVARLLAASGARFVRRSACDDPASLPSGTRWLLGDSVGEMAAYYAASDVAIIGGSFADFGGQNLVEASAVGVPVIVGPSTRNFAQAVEDAVAAGAALRAPDAEAALRAGARLLRDEAGRTAMNAAATKFVAAHRGATAAALEALAPYLGTAH